ncbi:MAG: DUF3971 domain-containing protein, partial [Usitatibacteraceae bacterium]
YFPVPNDIRNVATRFGPRGLVSKSSFAWTGYLDKMSTYRLKGTMSDFALNAEGDLPGVSGFSGGIDGDEKGGKFTIVSKNMQLDVPQIMRAPLKFEAFDGEGTWQVTPASIDVELGKVAFANADVAGEFAGRYGRFRADGPRAKEEKGPGTLDIKGKLTRAKAVAIANYLPNAASQTRDYIDWAVRDGEILSADFSLKGEIFEFPFHQGKGGHFRIAAKVKDVDYRYVEAWPTAENVNGEIVFENTGFSAKIDSGRFFNAKIKATTIAIDDLAASPGILTIKGAADARGEDMARYLRESPLANGVGAFTRSVAFEGPGALQLEMKIPIGGPARIRLIAARPNRYLVRSSQPSVAA